MTCGLMMPSAAIFNFNYRIISSYTRFNIRWVTYILQGEGGGGGGVLYFTRGITGIYFTIGNTHILHQRVIYILQQRGDLTYYIVGVIIICTVKPL